MGEILQPSDAEEMERYGNLTSWSEELGISKRTMRTRLQDVRGITGKNNWGKTLEDGFYAESDVRRCCEDLLIEMPKADKQGFFMIGEERYGSKDAWERELQLSEGVLDCRLSSEQGITGRDCVGRVRKNAYFCEQVMLDKCKDLLQDLPAADRDGFFVIDGIRYGHKHAWCKEMNVQMSTIKTRLDGVRGVTGKGMNGQVLEEGFFPESVVLQRCSAFVDGTPKTDKDGFMQYDGPNGVETYGNLSAWAKKLGVSVNTVIDRLKGVDSITALDSRNRLLKRGCYPESAIREKLGDFLREMPVADGNGFFVTEQDKFGTKEAWSREIGISTPALTTRLQGIDGVDGRNARGSIGKFYPERVVLGVCSDLLKRDA